MRRTRARSSRVLRLGCWRGRRRHARRIGWILFAAAAAVAVVLKGQRVSEGREEEGLGVCVARESGGRRVEDARRL